MQKSPYKILKLCVLGDLGVGKTSLCTRFVTEHFVKRYKPTYQACHFHKYLQTPDNSVYIQIWDTSGTERFRSVSPHIVRDSHGALLVYDISNMSSFVSLHHYWIQWVKDIVAEEFRMILVGNKIDKTSSRQIEKRFAERFASENGMLFYETSAKTGDTVDVVFLDGVNLLADTLDLQESVDLTRNDNQQHNICCGY